MNPVDSNPARVFLISLQWLDEDYRVLLHVLGVLPRDDFEDGHCRDCVLGFLPRDDFKDGHCRLEDQYIRIECFQVLPGTKHKKLLINVGNLYTQIYRKSFSHLLKRQSFLNTFKLPYFATTDEKGSEKWKVHKNILSNEQVNMPASKLR